MTRVKLCGLKRPCDIAWANELQPDYIGLVFAGKKRRVTDEQARELRKKLHPAIPAVGVFVNEPMDHIEELVHIQVIQLVQLHGQENEAYIGQLKKRIQAPLIKAYAIDTAEDVKEAEKSLADYILLDHGAGGTGTTFDWRLIQAIERPYFLAGGLDCCNVQQALALQPYAVDVSSGIETDGVKDKEKMKQFMMQVRLTSQEGIQ